jgi:hypothetical protein
LQKKTTPNIPMKYNKLKIKNVMSVLLFLISIAITAQQNKESSLIPPFIPLSPQAGSLGNYGSLPIDLSTGKMAFNWVWASTLLALVINGIKLGKAIPPSPSISKLRASASFKLVPTIRINSNLSPKLFGRYYHNSLRCCISNL